MGRFVHNAMFTRNVLVQKNSENSKYLLFNVRVLQTDQNTLIHLNNASRIGSVNKKLP